MNALLEFVFGLPSPEQMLLATLVGLTLGLRYRGLI